MTPLLADVAVVGEGVRAGATALELARAGRGPLVVPFTGAFEIGHVATGPAMAYAEAARRMGREAAREVWEAFRESHERLRAFLAGLPDDCGYRQRGGFLLASDRAEATALADSEDMLREDGFAGEFLDHYMLETRFEVAGFAGAYWAHDDAEVDADRLAAALRGAALERGATVAVLGALRGIVPTASGVEIVGEGGRAGAIQVLLTQDALLSLAGLKAPTGPVTQVEAEIAPSLALPSLARSVDGRVRWQGTEGGIRVQADGQSGGLDDLLRRLPARATARREAEALAVEDRLPVVGPVGNSTLVLAAGPEPVGLAFSVARWIAEWVRTGHDPTPPAFRASRLRVGPRT